MTKFYPLESVGKAETLQLGSAIWRWTLCAGCQASGNCNHFQCSTQRITELTSYYTFYTKLSRLFVPEASGAEDHALRNHHDLIELILAVRNHAHLTRGVITKEHFRARNLAASHSIAKTDQQRAVNLAVRAAWMINCSTASHDFATLELGGQSLPWRDDHSFVTFLEQSFPRSEHFSLNKYHTAAGDVDILAALTAPRLRKKAGLRFRPTNDLRDHLKVTHDGFVEIFHHLAFVKQCLLSTRDTLRASPRSTAEAVQQEHIPRQILLEILNSTQRVLFPSGHKSDQFLNYLVFKGVFNRDVLVYESAACRRTHEEDDSSYHYFGTRLMDLYDELQNPKPRKGIRKWMEDRSGDRHLMMATLIGIVIAISIGLLSLGVACFQAWISWQQWKHPTTPNGS